MAKAKTPKQLAAKIRSLKREITRVERARKKLIAGKRRKSAKRRPAKRRAVHRRKKRR